MTEKQEDKVVHLEMSMSELNFIIASLKDRSFTCDRIIDKIVNQGNPQLDKPVLKPATEVEQPIAITEEIDDTVLAIFSKEFHEYPGSLEFDFSRSGHIVVMSNLKGEQEKELTKRVKDFVDGLNMRVDINKQTEGVTVYVFSMQKKSKQNFSDRLSESQRKKNLAKKQGKGTPVENVPAIPSEETPVEEDREEDVADV